MMGNSIKDISSVNLVPYLLSLDASRNKIVNIDCLTLDNKLEYLQDLNLSGNKIIELVPIKLPNLRVLNLSKNKIISLEKFSGHSMLEKLDLKKNKLRKLSGLKNVPKL
jgi:Leucine-rich repeat (LRR) protein